MSYVIRHKWFVFVAGLKTGAPLWRLIIHDWSKFLPREWVPYATYFYGESPMRVARREFETRLGQRPNMEATEADIKHERQLAFDAAWLHHQHANPHHWQHWVLREDSGATKLLDMPEHFAREMVADWMGAGRAITGKWEAAEWYGKNASKIQLAPHTETFVRRLLREVAA